MGTRQHSKRPPRPSFWGFSTRRSVQERRALTWWVVGVVLLILVVDQGLKFWIKTNFYLGEQVMLLGDKVRLVFTENNGMAFGLSAGGELGKLLLSTFRIVATALLAYMLHWFIRFKEIPKGFVLGLAFIFVGALGNIIDGTFYGLLFSSSGGLEVLPDGQMAPAVATFLPAEGGYAPLFHGKVVDMFYCPIIDVVLPGWVPLWGGERFIFFEPIFNVADAAITCGVLYMLIFHWKFLTHGGKRR